MSDPEADALDALADALDAGARALRALAIARRAAPIVPGTTTPRYATAKHNPTGTARGFKAAGASGAFPTFKQGRAVAALWTDVERWIESRVRPPKRAATSEEEADREALRRVGVRFGGRRRPRPAVPGPPRCASRLKGRRASAALTVARPRRGAAEVGGLAVEVDASATAPLVALHEPQVEPGGRGQRRPSPAAGGRSGGAGAAGNA